MRALAYTLVLALVLVGLIAFLHSIQPDGGRPRKPRDADGSPPMVVRSDPAARSTLDPSQLDRTNREALYDTGLELLDLWHLPEAIEVFETLVAEDPEHLQAYLHLVECYSNPMIAAERRASECWRKAMESAARSGEDTVRVSAYKDLFIDGAAASAAAKLARTRRGSHGVDAKLVLAQAYLADGDVKSAEKLLEQLLDEDQSLGRAREMLVQCKTASGDHAQAESLARELAAIYAQEPYPYVLLARVLLVRGKLGEAAEFCNNALSMDSRYVPAIVARAQLYVAANEMEAARVSFEKLLLFDDAILGSIASEGLAHVDFLAGRFDEASSEMDETIRLAMSIESTRRGLYHAFRLVDYLCELGRVDAADAVVERWVRRGGTIPRHLGDLRIRISRGEVGMVRTALERVKDDETWRGWMRTLALDFTDIQALTFIQENDYAGALRVLNAAQSSPHHDPQRAYLKGYALFQSGNAEQAVDFFGASREAYQTLVFPYHGDPILYVQSIFFLGEAALARGEAEEARRHYETFLSFWGDAEWELQAVERARQKLTTLSPTRPEG